MDGSKTKSITLFLMMGLTVIGLVTYVFVFLPKQRGDTLGSKNLVLDSPVQRWNLTYLQEGIIPFGEGNREWLSIEVSDGSNIYSSTEGIVVSTSNNIVSIDVGDSFYIEYSSIRSPKVYEADIISKGEALGRVDGDYLNVRIKNVRDREYVCPYSYYNDFTKDLLDEAGDILEKEVMFCEKESLDY
jgi:hypothetical protein